MMPPPIFRTERFDLTALHQADASEMFRYRAHPEVRRYQSFDPQRVGDVESFIEKALRSDFDAPGSWFQLAIRERDTGALCGDIGIHTFADPAQVELGVSVAPDRQGAGVATEALTRVLDELFGARQKHRAMASIDPRNTACCRLFERLSFRREALHRESYRFRGGWADDAVYALLHAEWAAHQAG